MFETIIITVGVVLSLFAISKTNIKITIVHKAEELPKAAPTTQGLTQEELDTKVEQDQPPTFDDVVAAVHDILGGADDD